MKKNLLRALLLATVLGIGGTTASAATLVQKNVYAYDIRVTSTDKYKPVVAYKLNGKTSKVVIETYANGVKVGETNGTTNQTNNVTVTIPASVSGNITFKVVATTANKVTAPTLIVDEGTKNGYYQFYAPYGLTVNNCTESNTFGRVLVLENRNNKDVYGSTALTTYHSSTSNEGRGAMIYAFDPQMQPINNAAANNLYGFNGALNVNNSEVRGEYHRIKYSADGRLFLSTADPERYGLYELNPDNLNQAATNLTSTKGIKIWGFDTYGSGANLKIVTYSSSGENAPTSSTVKVYTLGTNTKLPAGTLVKSLSGTKAGGTGEISIVNDFATNLAFDPDGKGAFIGQYRGTPTDKEIQYAHATLTANGAIDWKNTTFVSNGAGMAYNKDYTLFARVEANNTVTLYKVAASNNGKVPTFTKVTSWDAKIGKVINQIAFDYANNIYVVGNNGEKVISWQLPSSVAGTSTTVPAPSSQAYKLEMPIKVTGKAKWVGNDQQAELTWGALNGAASYNIYRNGAKVSNVTTTTASIYLPMYNMMATPQPNVKKGVEYVVKAVDASGAEFAQSGPCVVYNLDYEKIKATATLETDPTTGKNDAVIKWDAPAHGEVYAYVVTRLKSETDANPVILKTIVVDTDGDLCQYIDENIHGNKYWYHIQVQMKKQVVIADGKNNSVTSSNVAGPVQRTGASQPVITQLESYNGRNSVRIKWDLPYSAGKASYYEVYRDGVKVVDRADYTQSIDVMVPNGGHSYTVVAVFSDGTRVTSEPKALESSIYRDRAVVQYGLEEIYNYPIVSSAEAAAKGLTDKNAFITDNAAHKAVVGNMHMAQSAYDTRGSIYRQGVFKNGKWYIAQLHDRMTVDGKTTITPSMDMALTTKAYEDANAHGGIIEFDAADDKILTSTPVRVVTNKAGYNQYIASDDVTNGNLNFATRTWDGVAQPTGAKDGYLFYSINASMEINHFNLENNKWSTPATTNGLEAASLYIAKNESDEITTAQTARVHYISGKGTLWGASGRLYVALNKLPIMYVYETGASGSGITTQRKYTANNLAVEPDANGRLLGSTENYAFPIAGREDFIWELRSNGYYYVNATSGEMTLIADEAVARNAGGMTFKFGKEGEQELFFIHPSGFHSNNTGHFLVDMAYRENDQNVDQADFTKLVPIASWTQKDLTEGEAANSNGQWYGVEYNEAEDCAYIYLYVPGVRFAKYRLYSYKSFPAVDPTLDVTIKHNDDDTDITHFDATITWKRPTEYAFSGKANNYEIRDYDVVLYDKEMKVVDSWKVDDPGTEDKAKVLSFSKYYDNHSDEAKHFVQEQLYTVHVTPNFVSTANRNRVIVGETGTAQDQTRYDADIESITAHSYKGSNFDGWRVELNLEPISKDICPEPVSHFTFDYSTDGGKTWQNIPELFIYKDGGKEYKATDIDQKIPGTYKFGDSQASTFAANNVQSDKAVFGGRPVMAVYTTFTEPDPTTLYRATAHYAATNKAIYKSASKTTRVEYKGTTGVDDIVSDGDLDNVSLFPVPATSTVTVRAGVAIETVQIYSLSGALVKNLDGNDLNEMTVDISELAAGNYLVSVNGQAPIRLIKK